MAKAGVQGTSDAGAVLGRKSKRKGREGRRQAKTAAASGGMLPARPEDPLEVWWWLPGPVLAPSLHLLYGFARSGLQLLIHGEGGWNLLHRQGALSTMGGVMICEGGRDTLGVSFRPLSRPHLPVPGSWRAWPLVQEAHACLGMSSLLLSAFPSPIRLSRFHPNRTS